MSKFILSDDTDYSRFHDHVTLNPLKSIDEQLQRKRLFHRHAGSVGDPFSIQQIIEQNSSLRVDFGWSFESDDYIKSILDECMEKIVPKYNPNMINIVSDMRCSWIGFTPLSISERTVYENLSMHDTIVFNNEIISFEKEIVEYIVNHKIFKQHALTRDSIYRFEYFKSIRKNASALEGAYWLYLDAIHDTIQIPQIPRDIIEQDIGCHFLNYPELFYELLTITKLKGNLL